MIRTTLAALFASLTLTLAAASPVEAAPVTKPGKVQPGGKAKSTVYVVYVKTAFGIQRYGMYASRQQADAIVKSLKASRRVAYFQAERVVAF